MNLAIHSNSHPITVQHDLDADAAYVTLAVGDHASTRRLDESRLVDLASDGTPLGVDLMHVSSGVDLTGLPFAKQIAAALRQRGIRVLQPFR